MEVINRGNLNKQKAILTIYDINGKELKGFYGGRLEIWEEACLWIHTSRIGAGVIYIEINAELKQAGGKVNYDVEFMRARVNMDSFLITTELEYIKPAEMAFILSRGALMQAGGKSNVKANNGNKSK